MFNGSPRTEWTPEPASVNCSLIKVAYGLAISLAVYSQVQRAISPFVMAALISGAFAWGDLEERWVISALAITAEILTIGPRLGLFAHSFDVAESRAGVILVGGAYLLILVVVAVRSPKWWPSWAAAFQLLLVLSHPLFVLLRDEIQPWAYASGIVIWTWLQLISIGCGVFDCWWRRSERTAKSRA